MNKKLELFDYYSFEFKDSIEFKIKSNKELKITTKVVVEDDECIPIITTLNPYDADRLRQFLNTIYDGSEGELK